jgi:hypothetical protein
MIGDVFWWDAKCGNKRSNNKKPTAKICFRSFDSLSRNSTAYLPQILSEESASMFLEEEEPVTFLLCKFSFVQ